MTGSWNAEVARRYIAALERRVAKLEHALAELDPLHPEINDHYVKERGGEEGSSATRSGFLSRSVKPL